MKSYLMKIEVPTVQSCAVYEMKTMINDKVHRQAFANIAEREMSQSPEDFIKSDLISEITRKRIVETVKKELPNFVKSGTVVTKKTNRIPSIRFTVTLI